MYYQFFIFIFQEFGPVDKLRLETRRLFPTLCPGTAPTTEHVYVPNHARGLVHRSLRRARGLCRPPSTIRSGTVRPAHQFESFGTVPTTEHYTLGDWSTSPPI